MTRNQQLCIFVWLNFPLGMIGMKILFGMACAAGLLSGLGAAGAADIGDTQLGYNWTGAYVGANAGYAFSDNRTSVDPNDFPIPMAFSGKLESMN